MTKQEYEANARNVYNLLKVTAEGIKKAKKKELNNGKEKDKTTTIAPHKKSC